MNNLVTISEKFKDQLTTTSFKVAEVFEKDHKNVIRDIEQLISNGVNQGGVLKFEHTPYKHPQNGQTYHYYEMNQDAFSILVMGYSGPKALDFKVKFLNAFNKMKELLNSDDYIVSRSLEIMSKRIESQTQVIQQLEQTNKIQETIIKEQASDVTYVKEVLQAQNAWTITTIAKELDMTANKLNKILCELSIQYKRDDHYVLHGKYNGNGYTKTKTHTYVNHLGETNTNIQTTWTESGRNFIHNQIKKFYGQGVARIAQ